MTIASLVIVPGRGTEYFITCLVVPMGLDPVISYRLRAVDAGSGPGAREDAASSMPRITAGSLTPSGSQWSSDKFNLGRKP